MAGGRAVADPLSTKIAEWMDGIEAATVELRLLQGLVRGGWQDELGEPDCRTPLGSVVQDVTTELGCAVDEIEALTKAASLVRRVAAQLDARDRAALARALELICTVDFSTRLDFLAGKVYELKRLRAAQAVN
jgi:hypothetical protein